MGRCMYPRIHGGKKVICKKGNLSALSGILENYFSPLGTISRNFEKKKVGGNFPN